MIREDCASDTLSSHCCCPYSVARVSSITRPHNGARDGTESKLKALAHTYGNLQRDLPDNAEKMFGKPVSNLRPSLRVDGCIISKRHASVSQERIGSDMRTCCHTETEVSN